MLEKLLAGEPDLEAIANPAQRRARMKIPEILRALEDHRVRDHHPRMIRFSLSIWLFWSGKSARSTPKLLEQIERECYRASFDLLQSIACVGDCRRLVAGRDGR